MIRGCGYCLGHPQVHGIRETRTHDNGFARYETVVQVFGCYDTHESDMDGCEARRTSGESCILIVVIHLFGSKEPLFGEIC